MMSDGLNHLNNGFACACAVKKGGVDEGMWDGRGGRCG